MNTNDGELAASNLKSVPIEECALAVTVSVQTALRADQWPKWPVHTNHREDKLLEIASDAGWAQN